MVLLRYLVDEAHVCVTLVQDELFSALRGPLFLKLGLVHLVHLHLEGAAPINFVVAGEDLGQVLSVCSTAETPLTHRYRTEPQEQCTCQLSIRLNLLYFFTSAL